MTDEPDAPSVPSGVPASLSAKLVDLNEGQLRAVAGFVQRLIDRRHPISEDIEPQEGEEIVRVEEGEYYTTVLKRQPCADGCEDCPHGLYLYHVRRESHPDGAEMLNWSYIGQIEE